MNASPCELRELTAAELEEVTGGLARGNLAGALRNLGKAGLSSALPSR